MSDHKPAPGPNRITGARRPAVAIVGFTEHRKLAPFGDPRFELWGLNELYRYMPMQDEKKQMLWHRWFEIHPRADFERPDDKGGDHAHLETLKKFPIPVYMTKKHDDIPPSIALPKRFIEDKVSTYMTSSIAWMMGLAIAEEFEEIHLFGIDMAQETEYQEQRPCVEYLLGLAQGRGIKVFVPPVADILKAIGQYGYESETNVMAKVIERHDFLQGQHTVLQQREAALEREYESKNADLRKQYEAQKNGLIRDRQHCEGAIDDCRFWRRQWGFQPAGNLTGAAATPDRSANPRLGIAKDAERKVLEFHRPAAEAALVAPAGSDGSSEAPK